MYREIGDTCFVSLSPLAHINNLAITSLYRSYIMTAFNNRVEKSNNVKVHILKIDARNLFLIIQVSESSE